MNITNSPLPIPPSTLTSADSTDQSSAADGRGERSSAAQISLQKQGPSLPSIEKALTAIGHEAGSDSASASKAHFGERAREQARQRGGESARRPQEQTLPVSDGLQVLADLRPAGRGAAAQPGSRFIEELGTGSGHAGLREEMQRLIDQNAAEHAPRAPAPTQEELVGGGLSASAGDVDSLVARAEWQRRSLNLDAQRASFLERGSDAHRWAFAQQGASLNDEQVAVVVDRAIENLRNRPLSQSQQPWYGPAQTPEQAKWSLITEIKALLEDWRS